MVLKTPNNKTFNKSDLFGPVTLKAFKAIDDPDSCQKFYDGHVGVLRSFGIEPISSAKKGWFENPNVYGIIAEWEGKVVGGVKIHKVGNGYPLPVEESIGYMDKRIYGIIEKHAIDGAGEGCGLWNSREVAGLGISFELSKAMLAITHQIGIQKLFLLASDHTLLMTRKIGFRAIKSLGNNGKFNYPTPKYIARVVLGHTKNFSWSLPYNRTYMYSLREKPMQKRVEIRSKCKLSLDFQLKLSSD